MKVQRKIVQSVLLCVAVLFILSLSSGCISGRGEPMSPRSEIEAALSIKLPNDSSNFNFKRVNPSTDLALSFAYIKFQSSEASYLSLVKELELQSVASADNNLVYPISGGDWKLVPGIQTLSWWDAGTSTPPSAASRSFPDGHIVVKYENGNVYAVKVSGMVK